MRVNVTFPQMCRQGRLSRNAATVNSQAASALKQKIHL
jgi:hypothetical protein